MSTGGGLSFLVRDVDELEDQGPTSDDTTTAGQEISTDDVLEDGGLASRLGAHYHLGTKGDIVSTCRSSLGWQKSIGLDTVHTIWGRSSESLPMVLKTRSCNLLTVFNRSSPSAAMAPDVVEPGVGGPPPGVLVVGAKARLVCCRGSSSQQLKLYDLM